MAAILIWSIGVQHSNIQHFTGIHSDKVLTIESKQNVRIQEEISPEDVYSVSQSENSWAVDPREPRNLTMEGTSIVHLKVLNIKEAEILPKYDKTFIPICPIHHWKLKYLILSMEKIYLVKRRFTTEGEISGFPTCWIHGLEVNMAD